MKIGHRVTFFMLSFLVFCVWLGTEQIMMIPALGQRGQSIKVGCMVGCTNR